MALLDHCSTPRGGFIMAVLACIMGPLSVVTAVMLLPVNPVTVVTIRHVVQLPLFLGLGLHQNTFKELFVPGDLFHLGCQTLYTSISIIFTYMAVVYISIGDAGCLKMCSPIVSAIGGHFFLKERAGWLVWFSVILAVVGGLFTTQPPIIFGSSQELSEQAWIGYLLAIISSLAAGSIPLAVRKMPRTPATAMRTGTAAFLSVVGALYMVSAKDYLIPACGWDTWVLLLAGGAIQALANYMKSNSYKSLRASSSALIGPGNAVFSYFYDYLFYDRMPNWKSLTGLVLIGISVVSISMKSVMAQKCRVFKIRTREAENDNDLATVAAS